MEIARRKTVLWVFTVLALTSLLATAALAYVVEDDDQDVGVYLWAWAYVKGDIWWDEETGMYWVTCLDRDHDYWMFDNYPHGYREIIEKGDPPVNESQPHSADSRTVVKLMNKGKNMWIQKHTLV